MKKFFLVAVLAALLSLPVTAEGSVVDNKGAMGLEFTMAGLGSFGIGGIPILVPAAAGFNTAYGIGAKYFMADKLALGVGLYLGATSDTAGGVVVTTFDMALRPYLTYTLVKKGPVALYGGAYLSLGMGSGKEDGANPSHQGTAFGFGASLGAEYFLFTGVSLGAEYQLGADFYSYSVTNAASVTTETSGSVFGTGSASVFLTFYL